MWKGRRKTLNWSSKTKRRRWRPEVKWKTLLNNIMLDSNPSERHLWHLWTASLWKWENSKRKNCWNLYYWVYFTYLTQLSGILSPTFSRLHASIYPTAMEQTSFSVLLLTHIFMKSFVGILEKQPWKGLILLSNKDSQNPWIALEYLCVVSVGSSEHLPGGSDQELAKCWEDEEIRFLDVRKSSLASLLIVPKSPDVFPKYQPKINEKYKL